MCGNSLQVEKRAEERERERDKKESSLSLFILVVCCVCVCVCVCVPCVQCAKYRRLLSYSSVRHEL